MTPVVPFVTALRSRPGVVSVGGPGTPRITVRVELPEQWDTIACDVRAGASVLELKRDALVEFGLGGAFVEDYLLKLRGFEVLGESRSVGESGARDGSTFLLTYRRRRPVR